MTKPDPINPARHAPPRNITPRERFQVFAALLFLFVVSQFALHAWGIVAYAERAHYAIPVLWLAWTLLDPNRRRRLQHGPTLLAGVFAILCGGIMLRLIDTVGSDYPAWTLSWRESLWRLWFSLSTAVIFGRVHALCGWLLQPLAKKSGAWRALSFLGAALLAIVVFLPYLFTFWSVHRPHRANLSDPRQAFKLPFERVTFPASDDGLQLRGWFVPAARPTNATVVVCHGIGANQSVFAGVLPFLHRANFNVLTFDFRGHGDSSGHTTSFGFYEERDVRGAVAFLKRRGQTRVALYGFSMGGAAVSLATRRLPDLRAVVLDSTFAEFAPLLEAQTGSSPLFGRALPVLARAFGRLELGFDAREIAPKRALAKRSPRPLLLIHGTGDALIPVAQARENFQAARKPKQLFLVPNAAHCYTRIVDPPPYEKRVTEFLRNALQD